MTLMVSIAADPAPFIEDDKTSLSDNLEIRQEMIQLINRTKKTNVVPELQNKTVVRIDS